MIADALLLFFSEAERHGPRTAEDDPPSRFEHQVPALGAVQKGPCLEHASRAQARAKSTLHPQTVFVLSCTPECPNDR